IQMLSFLSAITPYTMAFGCGTGNTDTFFVCRSYLLMAPPIIQPTYMLLFESKAMDCSHLMGFRTTLSGSIGIICSNFSVSGLKESRRFTLDGCTPECSASQIVPDGSIFTS